MGSKTVIGGKRWSRDQPRLAQWEQASWNLYADQVKRDHVTLGATATQTLALHLLYGGLNGATPERHCSGDNMI
jgi:hypothetical protein